MNTLRFGAILAIAAATTFACSGDDDDSTSSANNAGAPSETSGGAANENFGGAPAGVGLEIIGSYVDDFGGDQIITDRAWNDSVIAGYDNDTNVVYTQFPKDDKFNPGKFAKTVYTQPKNGSFYFCMVEFSLDTLAEAEASTATADATDPATSGCGADTGSGGAGGAASNGFPWTKATKK